MLYLDFVFKKNIIQPLGAIDLKFPILKGGGSTGQLKLGCESGNIWLFKNVNHIMGFELSANNQKPFVDVAVLENIVEAQLLESILAAENIPHRIRSYHDTAYDGLFQFQMGWGQINAPLIYKQKILEILKEIRAKTKKEVKS